MINGAEISASLHSNFEDDKPELQNIKKQTNKQIKQNKQKTTKIVLENGPLESLDKI